MASTDPSRDDSPVPMLDLAPLHAKLRADIDSAIARVIDSNAFVLGKHLEDFENEAAAYLGSRHAVGVASGTDALLLSLKAAGIGSGDEVILPAFTFFGTIEAVLHVGATPVFADIRADTITIDMRHAETLVTPRSRAILPVHMFGRVADMQEIMSIARRHGLCVIEDAAQAFGARAAGKAAGTFGTAGCFSFHPTKPLGALGDGGLVCTDDETFAKRLRELRNHGSGSRYRHTSIGYTSRLDSLQAAVLDVKLRYLPRHLAERERLAANYRRLLDGLPLDLPPPMKDGRHANAQFTVCLDERERVRAQLEDRRIATAVHYPLPAYRQPALAGRVAETLSLPVTERVCERCLSLPLYEGLSTRQQERVAEAIAIAVSRQTD